MAQKYMLSTQGKFQNELNLVTLAEIERDSSFKKREVRSNQPPYISTYMRKAIWMQKRLYKYRYRYRNACTKRTTQNKWIFWNSVKPFLTFKSSTGSGEIILSENSKIIFEQSEIAEIMNDFFVNVAADIGKAHTLSDL